jgi:hypothetical protein
MEGFTQIMILVQVKIFAKGASKNFWQLTGQIQ